VFEQKQEIIPIDLRFSKFLDVPTSWFSGMQDLRICIDKKVGNLISTACIK